MYCIQQIFMSQAIGHISYILEANSKRLTDFSFIGRKPNEILQFKWKRFMVLKFKPKLNLKFMLKRSKTIKIMKGSKNRGRLTQVKVLLYVTCFCIYRKQEISIYYDSKEIHAIEYCFWLWCTFWASYWHIKCKVSWERTFKRLHNWAIYRKDFLFGIQ